MDQLISRFTPGAQVAQLDASTWRLSIPQGPAGRYRLAQLDDYSARSRGVFLWRVPFWLRLQARVSAPDLPGTWGFGLWNDPFSISFGLGGMARRFPALPDAAWFFFASPANYLSFRDDLPASDFLAATFRSVGLPGWLLAPGVLAAPGLMLPGLSRLLRRALRILVRQDAVLVAGDPTAWHEYSLDWKEDLVQFRVDEVLTLETPTAPRGPLGLVLWIDNQYAAFPPNGRLGYGMLANPEPAWLEIRDIVFAPK